MYGFNFNVFLFYMSHKISCFSSGLSIFKDGLLVENEELEEV